MFPLQSSILSLYLSRIDETHMTLLLEYSTKGEKLDDLEFNVILGLFSDP